VIAISFDTSRSGSVAGGLIEYEEPGGDRRSREKARATGPRIRAAGVSCRRGFRSTSRDTAVTRRLPPRQPCGARWCPGRVKAALQPRCPVPRSSDQTEILVDETRANHVGGVRLRNRVWPPCP